MQFVFFTHLCTKLEIDDYNGDQRATHRENYKHKEQKSEQIIKLIFPDCLKEFEQN